MENGAGIGDTVHSSARSFSATGASPAGCGDEGGPLSSTLSAELGRDFRGCGCVWGVIYGWGKI